MYEVGIARAKNRPLIMIATSSRSIPFDIANVRVIIFDLANPNEFVSRLSSAIEEAFRSPTLFKTKSRDRERKTTVFISYSHIDVEYWIGSSFTSNHLRRVAQEVIYYQVASEVERRLANI
jgi:hypothetical protein